MIKVLNGCGLNDRFWVFAGGLTNVEVKIRVTDTVAGVTRKYANPLSTAFQPILDTGAFATCVDDSGPRLVTPGRLRPPGASSTGGCAPSGSQLCVNRSRFSIAVTDRTQAGI